MADPVIDWLRSGDPSIAYQATRDLIGQDHPRLRTRIATTGWGAALLAARHPDGHWGERFYSPKWTSTHYTLLDLRNLAAPTTEAIRVSVAQVTEEMNAGRPGGLATYTDTCVNGMALNYAAFFGAPVAALAPYIDFLLADRMGDGGFNCQRSRGGARHSSLHSTLSVLEGFASYLAAGHSYRADEVAASAEAAREFILMHRLFRSDHTGAVINPDFLRFPTHPRWYYNILRALDHFADVAAPHDARMDEALERIVAKRMADGRWRANAAKPGKLHLVMEPAGQPSRIVTLAALRVLKAYG